MNRNIVLGALIILGVLFAWLWIGDIALAGLFALFGLSGKKQEKRAETLNSEANEQVKMANHLVDQATELQEQVESINQSLNSSINQSVDKDKPIDDVVKNAKRDWD